MLRGRHFTGRRLALLVAILAMAAFAPVAAEATMATPNSRELKLLIQTDVFADRAEGYKQCWGIVKDLATEMGIQVVEVKDPFDEGARKVMYLDTGSEQLRKENLSLRLRIKIKDGKLENKVDLNLKYRRSDVDTVPSDAVTAAAGIKASFSYEEDVAGFIGGVVGQSSSAASMACTIKGVAVERLSGNTLGVYVEHFPSLARLGIPADSQLEMVGAIAIREHKVTPGELDFGQGMSTEVDISVWYNFDTGKIITAEISYGSALGQDAPAAAVARAEAFFNALQERMAGILAPGGMKTDFLR
ncbi:MAG TPA: hypothetical protein PLG65_05565 [Bacillota bacterium]|nr:hypothetical protein [Bacillota bacterium]